VPRKKGGDDTLDVLSYLDDILPREGEEKKEEGGRKEGKKKTRGRAFLLMHERQGEKRRGKAERGKGEEEAHMIEIFQRHEGCGPGQGGGEEKKGKGDSKKGRRKKRKGRSGRAGSNIL